MHTGQTATGTEFNKCVETERSTVCWKTENGSDLSIVAVKPGLKEALDVSYVCMQPWNGF